MFRELALLPSSGESIKPDLLGPLDAGSVSPTTELHGHAKRFITSVCECLSSVRTVTNRVILTMKTLLSSPSIKTPHCSSFLVS
jgi:hypothetical protein